MENRNSDTYVNESQIIAEEVLFELGQSGSANPHRRSLPWLNSNTLIVTETAAFRDGTSKHSQERRTALKAKTLCRVGRVAQPSHPHSHTLQKQTPCVLHTCICYLACWHVTQNIPAGFKQQALLFGRKEVLPLLRSSFMKKKKNLKKPHNV